MTDKKKKPQKSLADPTTIQPIDRQQDLLQIIIETPKGSRNKYAFDPEQEIFSLKKVLPKGMAFPYDFGFIPQSLAPDGDPIDVLVLMDQPAFPGCLLQAKLLGVIEGEQIDGKDRIRNDRLIAVADQNHSYAKIKKIGDLPKQFLRELEEFFVNYHKLEGKKYKLLGLHGYKHAMSLIDHARKAA